MRKVDGIDILRHVISNSIKLFNNKLNSQEIIDESEDKLWVMVSEKDCDTVLVDHYM